MDAPNLTAEMLAALPADVLAFINWLLKENARLRCEVAELKAEVAELRDRLNKNSSNSSKPPSTDLPFQKPAPKKPPSGKRAGGQPGHPRHARPPRPITRVVDVIPDTCGCCGRMLLGYDAQPACHQVVELPPIQPEVVEYRVHRLTCLACGEATRAATPPEAQHEYGARLQAMLALLGGEYRLGKRKIVALCEGLLNLEISTGQVCALEKETAATLQPIVEEARAYVQQQPANIDETGWREGAKRAWLWVAATRLVAVFAIMGSRSRAAFEQWMGGHRQVITTDRYGAYSHLPPERRQLCWAHLRRDFQAMIDRGNVGQAVGQELLEVADAMLGHWKLVRDGMRSREAFQSQILPALQTAFAAALERGAGCGCAKTAGVCMELRRWQPSLWTFAFVPEVEPTNNAAERAVRHAVCWRKTSYGTASAVGSRFVERILTLVATCRLQGRKSLEFLRNAVQATRNGTPHPSLLPT
jgi:transposase